MQKLLFIISLIISSSTFSQFGPQNELTKSVASPTDVKSFDLDGDGDMDVLSSSYMDDKIVWFENLGDGTFGTRQVITNNANAAQSVYAADLDSDGDLDVLSSSILDNKIVWYENLGGGNFDAQQIITISANGAKSVYAIDLDSDGDMDVLSASEWDDKITWYENLGGGNFGPQQIVTTNADGAKSVYAADLDGDGDMDVLSASYFDDKIAWYENLGEGSFGAQQIITTNADGANSVYVADLDADGDMDVLSASITDDKIAWYENLGEGSFGAQQIITTSADGAQSVFAADLDSDGDLDVLSASEADNKIAWYKNLGGGNFDAQQVITTSAEGARYAYAADLDDDGDIDVLSASYWDDKIAWHENLGGGNFDAQQVITTSDNGANSIYATDLDGDGDMDVLSASYNANSTSYNDDKIVWYENLGGGNFDAQQIITTNVDGAFSVYAADLDSDGDPDILSASITDDKIAWYENLGGGNFDAQQIITTNADGAQSVFAADLDGDGDMDVLSASYGDDKIAWYENLGGGSFGTQQVITDSADRARSVYAIDLDSDGDMDVLSASYNDDKIAWYENSGGGNFGVQQIITTSADGANSVYAADLDNDGDPDVLSASRVDDKIAWYENTGGGNFGPQQIISTSTNFAKSAYATDLDGDGDMDVLSASQGYNKIAWYENTGGGNFGPQQIISTKVLGVQSIYATDLDGDGDPDVLSASITDDKIAWYENFFDSKHKLEGKVFYDANQNAQLNSTEQGLLFKTKLKANNPLTNFTINTGYYYYAVDTGTYTVSYMPDTSWTLTTDSSSYTKMLTGGNPVAGSLNFGFYPNTFLSIIKPSLTGGFPRCNNTINYWSAIRNQGTSLPNGIVHLQLNDDITYVSASVTPDSIIGQSIYWHYDSLFFFAEEYFKIQVQMPPFTSMGDTLTSVLTVHELDGSNNIIYTKADTLNQVLVCAYDPNDKNVTPKGMGTQGYILNNQKLKYLIRFQNTGNDTAMTVMVRDQLDADLDWSTLQPIASSHPMQVSIEQDGEVVFKFENIMLPDSGANFLGSQGFVRFEINMKPNLSPKTIIRNTSHIYFDYNPAVITNTVLNTIYDCNTVPINIPHSTTCFGEKLIALSTERHNFNNYTWGIDSFYTATTDPLKWVADTVGTFNLKLTISNELCSKDTTTSITILPAISITNANQFICQGDSMLLGGVFQVSAATYNDTLQSVLGCDSIVSTTLIVNPTYLNNQNDSICQGDSMLIYGAYQSTTGVYYDSLQTTLGCDSILSTTLTISIPNTTIATFNPDTVCSSVGTISLPTGSPAGGIYTGTGVSGGNFDPLSAGDGTHDVIYTFTDTNSCTNSDTTIITVQNCTGIDEVGNDFGILIYPNPNTGLFTIEKPIELNSEVRVKLLDVTSKLIIEKVMPVGQQKVEVNITSYSKGIYYLQLMVGDEVFVKQILKD